MKQIVAILVLAGVAFTLPASAKNMCLDTRNISSSDSRDGKTMTFKMKDGRTLVNHLQGYCPNLKFNGFAWKLPTGTNQVCERESSFVTLTGAQTCTLGKFDAS